MHPHYFYCAGEWHPCHRPHTAIPGGVGHPWPSGPRSVRSFEAWLPGRRRRPTACKRIPAHDNPTLPIHGRQQRTNPAGGIHARLRGHPCPRSGRRAECTIH
jgi:hypothetical protein